MKKLWGNAFTHQPTKQVLGYCAGYDAKPFPALDSLLLPSEIKVNLAHAEMLCESKIISSSELKRLKSALHDAEKLALQGKFPLQGFEDMHSALESFLSKKTKAALKLHSGRSRNDLIATTTRLYLMQKTGEFACSLETLVAALEKTAAKHAGTPMPGFSHHRPAMPYTYGKWLQSYAAAFARDAQSFKDFAKLYDECPLGACAGFGTGFPIAPHSTAKKLGFEKSFSSSLDAVQQRWEAEASFCFALSKTMNHCSQICESLIVLSMPEMELVTLPEEYCTGSSVMPHKKNPDFFEATKAKASLAAGALSQLVDAGKNSFTGYNRDSQWTKKALLNAIIECEQAPALLADAIAKTIPNKEKMAAMAAGLTQTAQAERLAMQKGVPFRKAKEAVEKLLKKEAQSTATAPNSRKKTYI